MKRKITVLFILLALVLSLTAGVNAAVVYDLTISEDLQQVTIGADTYVRANTTMLYGYYYEQTVTVTFTDAQKELYDGVKLYFQHDENHVIQVELLNKDGSSMKISYVRADLYESFQQLLEQEEYTVDFQWPANNSAIVDKSQLFGEATTLYLDDLRYSRDFEVYVTNDFEMIIKKGYLVVVDEEYYYVDFEESGLTSEDQVYNLPRVEAYKITDTDLQARFDEAMGEYYDDGLGVLEDEETVGNVAGIIAIVLFGLLPAATLIAFTVFAIVTKKRTYRVMYIVVAANALVVLAIMLAIILIV